MRQAGGTGHSREETVMAKRKPDPEEIPSTIARSDEHAQRIWKETHDSAVDSYGEGERAHRTAFSALKHSYEKVGDHWEAKDEKGPSDDQAARGGAKARRGGETAGGVDANASKQHLYDLAKRLDIPGRSRMTKRELTEAIDKANQRETAKARRSG
jgi:cation transport regulator ChaB